MKVPTSVAGTTTKMTISIGAEEVEARLALALVHDLTTPMELIWVSMLMQLDCSRTGLDENDMFA